MQVASPDAFALAIGDSIPLQEVERQLLADVRRSVQTRNAAGNRDLSLEDGQLFFRLRFSGRQVDIDSIKAGHRLRGIHLELFLSGIERDKPITNSRAEHARFRGGITAGTVPWR